LPHYAHELSVSKGAIGILVGAYPTGMLPGSLLGAWTATRAGVRRTTVVGLMLFAVSTAVFGFASSIAVLDAMRFVQGVACGFVWAGGLAWVIAIAPRERRGEALGSAIGAAIFGTLVGPIVGTLAVAAGAELVFSCVAATSLGLAAWALHHPNPPPADTTVTRPAYALARSPVIVVGVWIILLEACTVGATETLLPLRLSRFGATGVAIGLTFVLTSLASAALARPVGRVVDRRGAQLPLCSGLALAAIFLALLPIPSSALGLAVLTVIGLGGPLTAYTIPAMSVITDSAERMGIPLAIATMLFNLSWATGETFGAPAAAVISQATSDTVALLLLSLLMVLTLPSVVRLRVTAHRHEAPGPAVGAIPPGICYDNDG
jgi:predicted MFS family arabinose efflux permease